MPITAPPTAAPLITPLRQITAKEWINIETAWKSGTVTYLDLAKKYGRGVSTFERHFKKKKVVKGSDAEKIRAKVEEALEKAVITDATVQAARIKETKEEHYKMASAIARLTWNEILAAKKDSKPVAIALSNLKALDATMTILKKSREERYSVLGLDRPDAIDPDQVPELIISELTAEEVQELRDRDFTEIESAATVQTSVDVLEDDTVDESDDQ
ncbi:hypothetical protein LP414_27745 [Polaromonas sp. P1(28)-13]|nr:hypothetical protein LP414_27745 [Polaromonas sp. P1(28)-13]